MKSKAFAFLAIVFVSGCAQMPTANVPLSYAKLDSGYLNSGIYDLGSVFAWDRDNNTLTRMDPLTVSPSLKRVGVLVALQRANLSSDTDIEFSGNIAAKASANLKTTIARNTTTELDQVAQETARTEALLNADNKKTRSWRQGLAKTFAEGNMRLVLVDQVLRGKKVLVGFSNSAAASPGANILKYGDVTLRVTYGGQGTFTQTGKGVPLVIQARLFRLAKDSEDPQFIQVTGTEAAQFNFQQAIKNLK
jgi:hypothetical protein